MWGTPGAIVDLGAIGWDWTQRFIDAGRRVVAVDPFFSDADVDRESDDLGVFRGVVTAVRGQIEIARDGHASTTRGPRDQGRERTVAVQVRMPGGTGRVMGDTSERQAIAPFEGTSEQLAEELRAYAREGIGHVQLVLDPITEASVAALAPALELLDRG